ncbi:hypothetical protein [Clostridium kluyveri]|uniref:DUF2726 domain-containing protein n=1 Tax=Clostridium kluyveri TaxID=1534 RepID=A0A1L5F4N2_CLOKL|nr:hypothetical protein [Clostridium kluyveri]APM37790.1 hypothetical protein BS101_03040 [Clostridium kluyveri]
MNKSFEKIRSSNILKYEYKSHDLKQNFDISVLNHIKNLEDKIFNNYTGISEEIINLLPTIYLTQISDIDKKFEKIITEFDKLNENGKKQIFSYIYWKYKNEKSNEKVDVLKIKRVIGFKGAKENYIEPVGVKVKCLKCNGKAFIYFYNYDLNCTKYKCIDCNHEEEREINMHDKFDNLLKCSCSDCLNVKKELFYVIKDNLKNVITEINSQLLNKYFEINDTEIPSQFIMEKDFKLYRSNLTKDEREVLSFSPKCKKELYMIIKDIEERDSNYNNKRNNVFENLILHRVIYSIRKKKGKDEIKDLLFKRAIDEILEIQNFNRYSIMAMNEKIECLNKLYNYLDDITFDEFFDGKFFKIKYNDHIIFKFEKFRIKYSNDLYLDLSNEYFTYDIIFNDCYMKKEKRTNIPSNTELLKKGLIKNIFKSSAEINKYIYLKDEYTDCIIVPNYNFSKIFNVYSLEHFLNDNELNYLKTCELDFVICNKEGIPFRVEEVQKGDHHNDNEWIWKDNVKKRALQILGIEFEEIF